MTILEAITQLQNVKENQYDDDTIVRWLSDLDGIIYEEIVKWHITVDEDGNEIEVSHGPYNPKTDMDTVLMVPDPYSDVYIKYLSAQVDYYNAELARYNNSMIMYNVALSSFADWYNRVHLPKQDNFVRL